MKAILYLFLMAVVPYSLLHAQDHPVYWLHGMQTNTIPTSDQFPGRWDKYAVKFAGERELTSFNPNYARTQGEVTGGVVNAANVLAPQIANNQHAIIIAHSMGGLVARELDRRNLKTIGGMVTIGTAHNGAKIAKNVQNGQVMVAAERGVKVLFNAPLATFIDLIDNPFGIQINQRGIQLASYIIDILWLNLLSNSVINQLPPTNSNTLRDLVPNSNFLSTINATDPHVPMINVVLKESNHEVFRMAGAAEQHPEDAPLHQFDDNKINAWRTKTKSWYKVGKDFYDVLKWANPWSYSYFNRLSGKYKTAETYCDHAMETEYNNLNGGISVVSRTTNREVWRCNNSGISNSGGRSIYMPIEPLPDPEDCQSINSPSECNNCQWVTEPVTTYSTEHFGQDGLVSVPAQIPEVNIDGVYNTYNVNHMEVGNHSEMTITLDAIFERNPGPFYRKKR